MTFGAMTFAFDAGIQHDGGAGVAAMLPPGVGWWIIGIGISGVVIAALGALLGGRTFRPPDGAFPQSDGAGPKNPIADYIAAFPSFTSNARLLLYRVAIGSLAFPTWDVLFNLYLLAIGFDVRFIGAMLFWAWLLHGAFAFPAGLISDRYGRRITYLVSNSLLIAFTLSKLFTRDPHALLVLSALAGAAEGFHAVTGAPFMMENSTPRERTHLFALYSLLATLSGTFGRIASGAVAVLAALALHVGSDSAAALRGAMFVAAPFVAASLIPIVLMRESWSRADEPWWRLIRSRSTIAALVGTTFVASLGTGFVFPFLNVVFHERLGVPDDLVGVVFAVGTGAGFVAGLFTPWFVRRFDRVKTILIGAFAGAAFTGLMGVGVALGAGFLALVTGAYAGRLAALQLFGAVENQYSMELVGEKERGVTAGLMHAASEFPMAVGTAVAASIMAGGDWVLPYWWGASLMAVSYAAFAALFRDARTAAVPSAAAVPAR